MPLCDVHECREEYVGTHEGSNFCKKHLSAFVTPEQMDDFDKQFEEAMEKAQENAPHPLLNPDSTHYQMFDGVESIERLEQMFKVWELMAWAKITAFKYRMRIGNKDSCEKEVVKIQTYEAYYKYLEAKLK